MPFIFIICIYNVTFTEFSEVHSVIGMCFNVVKRATIVNH